MGYLILALLLGLIPAAIAKGKGYNFFLWWFYGAMLFIVALPFSIVLKSKTSVAAATATRKCPKCAELIQPEAVKCKHCGSDLEPLSAEEQSAQAAAAKEQAKKANYVPGWIVAVALVAVIGLIVVAAENSDDGNSSASPSALTTAAANDSPSPANNPALKVGQTFNAGDVQITIESVKLTSHLGTDFTQSTPAQGGIYVAIKWKYKNISNKPITAFDKPTLVLIDPNGNSYDPDIGASASYASEGDEDEKVLSDLNPGITVTSADAFEVGKNAFNRSNWFIAIKGDEGTKISMAKK